MALTLGDNFSYLGAKPLDGRVKYDTIADMVAMSANTLYDGIIAFCVADGKNYQWKSTNDVDETLGKWRELATGGGGETYSDFTGATSSTAGAHGLVPAPSAGDEGKVLFGNGAWGALPSVDLSMLSNEAFMLSTTEKAIGTYIDGKILYGKVVDMGALPNNATKSVSAGVSDVDTVSLCYLTVVYQENNTNLTFITTGMPTLNPHETVEYRNGNINFNTTIDRSGCYGKCTIFYTKTTDSPLASDEKFAGVTASGEVIYKKTISSSSYWDLPSNTWTSTGVSISNVSIVDCKALRLERSIGGISAWADNGVLKLLSVRQTGDEIDTITLYYTKTTD